MSTAILSPPARVQWVLNLRIDAYSKSVLHSLSHRVNADGACWPSIDRLASDSGICPRKARNVIRHLTTLGLVSVEVSNGRATNKYHVRFDINPAQCAEIESRQPGTPRRVKPVRPGTIGTSTRHITSLNPAQRAAKQYKEQIKNKAAPAAPSVWDLGLAMLGESKRPLIGKLISEFGEDEVAKAIAITSAKNPAEPLQYIRGILKNTKHEETRRVANNY